MSEKKPERINFNGIICEYLLSEVGDKVLILLDGLPNVPQRNTIINLFNKRGFSVFYPRYRGTWESAGEFLAFSPVKDVEEVITNIVKGFTSITGNLFKSDNIRILSSSFGGAIALSLQLQSEIKKIVSLSPVYDFKKVKHIDTLEDYVTNNFPMAYRFSHENWEKLLNNCIVSPINTFDHSTAPLHRVIIGGLDEQVDSKELELFCSERSIRSKTLAESGHLSFSKINEELADEIVSLLVD